MYARELLGILLRRGIPVTEQSCVDGTRMVLLETLVMLRFEKQK